MKLIVPSIVFCLPLASRGFVAPHQSQAQAQTRVHNDLPHQHVREFNAGNGVPSVHITTSLQMMQTQGKAKKQTQGKATNNNPPPSSPEPAGLNFGLIAQNAANQALIGSTIWTGGNGYEVLMNKANFGLFGILLGVAGVLPMLALSRQIETSESYAVSGLNLSTNMAVLRIFGATPKPLTAFLVSVFLASLTGVVEETTFRGQILPVFANRFGDGDIVTGVALSTLLFAFLHTNPLSFFKGDKDAKLDNLILFTLQIINGSYFAALYLTTDNLAVPIIAHGIYDFYTFYKTHLVDVAGQMDYASRESKMPSMNPVLQTKWTLARSDDFVKGVQQSFYLMDTNRDGVLSRKELRVALFSYGINLSQLQSKRVAKQADLDQSGDIDLNEFVEFVGPSGSTAKAVRNTLFGPL